MKPPLFSFEATICVAVENHLESAGSVLLSFSDEELQRINAWRTQEAAWKVGDHLDFQWVKHGKTMPCLHTKNDWGMIPMKHCSGGIVMGYLATGAGLVPFSEHDLFSCQNT